MTGPDVLGVLARYVGNAVRDADSDALTCVYRSLTEYAGTISAPLACTLRLSDEL